MAFFDDMTEKLTKAGQGVAQSTKNLAATAKLNASIAEEEKNIKGFYAKLGEAYYLAHNEDPSEDMAELTRAVTEALERINGYREELQEIKGVRLCPNCGSEISADSAFCGHCGTKIEQE